MGDGFLEQMDAQVRGAVEVYRGGKKHGQLTSRELKEVIEGIIATDYDGRTVIELLQNGHDAHPADCRDGQVEFLLDEDEGQWGVLYAANGGNPVRHEDFQAMCRVAMSNKRPDEGIGNKGVGFKSVLQLTASPEIYSAAAPGTRRLDGYCFRFARHDDFDDIAARFAPDEPGFADELRDNVTALKLPVPQESRPPVVDDFAAKGYVTVVRLPLRSGEALSQAQRQLNELTEMQVPFDLFLDRVARITITQVKAGQSIAQTVRTKTATRRFDNGILAVDDVVLRGSRRYLVLRRRVPEAQVQEAIARSRDDARVNAIWGRWEGDAWVSVALPADTPLAQGRLYTFLPMGEEAHAPVPGFVHAPFFARLDRRSLDLSMPLNDLFLRQAATLCAEATQLAIGGELEMDHGLLVDLVTWSQRFLPLLVEAFAALGTPLPDVPFIPALGARTATRISTGWLWEADTSTFTPASVAAARVDDLIDPSLAPLRRQRLHRLADQLEYTLRPGAEELAAWAETYAETLAAQPFDSRRWAAFYQDLAQAIDSGKSLTGRRIIVDGQGTLVPAGGDTDSGPKVFLAPQAGDDEKISVDPPPAIAERIAFTHPEIAWRTDPRGGQRPARDWFLQHGLLLEYRTATVLRLVGDAMQATETGQTLRAYLMFAVSLYRGAVRQVAAEVVAEAGLRVPTVGGWRPAAEAMFGAGWGGRSHKIDELFAGLLRRASSVPDFAELASRMLTEPHQLVDTQDDIDALRTFLEHAGANHGLTPRWLPSSKFIRSGWDLRNPTSAAPHIPTNELPSTQQETWRAVAAGWPRHAPAYVYVDYRPATDIAMLPGQAHHAGLDPAVKLQYCQLVLHGLATWPDHALEIHYARNSDPLGAKWPTPLTAFLATAEWLPQTTPGRRGDIEFISPARAWWLKEDETPDFLRAQPAALRQLATPEVLDRLTKIGVRFWDVPETAAARLVELTEMFGSHRLTQRTRAAARKAYERSWRDLVAADGIPPLQPLQVVAALAGDLLAVPATDENTIIYVLDQAGVTKEKLLQQAPVLILAVRDRGLAEHAQQVLETAGARGLRRASLADVSITVDGLPPHQAPHRPLLDTAGRWLTALVLGVMEFRSRGLADVTPQMLKQAAERLQSATVTLAEEFHTTIDGHQVDSDRAARSILLEVDACPRVVVGYRPGQPTLAILQAASHGLAELVGMPAEADAVRLALIDLEQRCGDSPPEPADVAAVLGVSVEELTSLVAAYTSVHTLVTDLLPVVGCVDIDLAEQLSDGRDQFDGKEGLRAWLTPRLPQMSVTVEVLFDLAERGDLLEAVRVLGVDLATANANLRALSLPPLHNGQGHATQFSAYLQRHRGALQDRIRDAYLRVYQANQPLDEYMRLQQLPDLLPDVQWLDQYWDLPEELIAGHIETWLQQHHIDPGAGSNLPPVDELRESNRRRLSSILGNAAIVIEAWLHRNTAGEGLRPAAPAAVAENMIRTGVLDFEHITAPVVARWLHANHQWPSTMALTTNRAELGLSEQDLADARQRLSQASQEKLVRLSYIDFGGRTYAAQTDLQELAAAIRSSLTAQLLATPATVVEPSTTEHPPRRPSNGGFTATARPAVPHETLEGIGLIGEIVAGEWLLHHYGVPPEQSWVSGNRNRLFGDGRGNDSKGYDFEIITSDSNMFFEVKATTGADTEFTLGETEVRTAQDLQPTQQYLILYIQRVREPAHMAITPLPNPLAPGGLRHYRVAGRSMRFRFDLDDSQSPDPG